MIFNLTLILSNLITMHLAMGCFLVLPVWIQGASIICMFYTFHQIWKILCHDFVNTINCLDPPFSLLLKPDDLSGVSLALIPQNNTLCLFIYCDCLFIHSFEIKFPFIFLFSYVSTVLSSPSSEILLYYYIFYF